MDLGLQFVSVDLEKIKKQQRKNKKKDRKDKKQKRKVGLLSKPVQISQKGASNLFLEKNSRFTIVRQLQMTVPDRYVLSVKSQLFFQKRSLELLL